MKVTIIWLLVNIVSSILFCFTFDWVKWQAELDLADPEQLNYQIKMEKENLWEGEPLCVRCILINHSTKAAKIIMPANDRNELLYFARISYSVSNNADSLSLYFRNLHCDVSPRPKHEKLIMAGDTLYINGILSPDNFFNIKKREIITLRPGSYTLFSRIFLGTKFIPEPPRALLIYSDTAKFIIKPIVAKEKSRLLKIRPFMKEFFGYGEEMGVSDSCRNLAYPVLDEIKRTDSYLAPYADFVHISMLAFDGDKNKLASGIREAKRFIKKYQGSILGEEMEFLLVKMLYLKEGKSDEFYKQSKQIIEKYSKNINCFGVKKLMEDK